MKKFLFTLAALLSLGLAANAGNLHPGEYIPDAPTIVYGDLQGNEISEITLAPGESQELSFILKQMNCTMISGFGIQWRMFDAEHNPINYAADAMVQCAKVYGTRTKFWFNPIGIGTNDPSQGGYNGVSLANATPYDNVYRILATNTVENMIFFVEDLDGNPTCPAMFGNYTIQVAEDWAEDFATLELDVVYSLFNSCPDYDPNDYWESVYPADYSMVLTIKNANAAPPTPQQVADPVVAYSLENDVLTVTFTCETEGAHIWINGVDMGEAPYSFTVERTYEDQTISGTAVAKLDGMTDSNEVPYNYELTAMDQPLAAEPVINFTEDNDGVTITVTNATEFTVSVDGTQVYPNRDGSYYVEKTYDRTQTIEVYAKNDPGYPYIASEDTKTYTLTTKEKADVNAPTITYDITEDALVVTVTPDPNTDGELVYDGQYSYPRLESDYEVTVTAYTAAGATCNASAPTTVTFIVPAYVPPTPVETMTFVKVTSADQLVAGKKYIFVCEGYAMGAAATGNFLTPIAITAGDEVEVTNEVAILTLGGTTGAYTFELNGNYLLGANGTGLSFGEDANNAKWILNNNNGALDGYRARNAQYDTRSIKKHNTMERFGHYANSDVNSTFALLYVEKSDAPVDVVADPTISFTEDGDVLTVTVSCETPGATLYVNGIEVENPYSYTVNRTYEDQVINIEAYAVNGTATSETVTDSYTFDAMAQPYASMPVITFDEDASGVMITIDNYTEYTIKVDGTQVDPSRDAHNYYVEKVYDRTRAIEVYAKNDPGYPYIAVDTTANYTLAAKAKAKNSTPSITYTYDNVAGTITVSAYGCTEEDVVYTLIDPDGVEHESPYTFNYNTTQGYDAFWTATAVSPTTTVSDACAPYEVIVEAVVPETPAPVVTIDDDSDPTTITAVGEGTVTIYVGGVPAASGQGTVTYEIPWGAEETYVSVYAVAHVENQIDGVSTTQYAYVGKVDTPITEVGAPTFSGYTIDGITGYGVYITPTTPGSSIMYRVFTYNEETGQYDIPVTDGWQEYTGAEGEIYYTDMGGKYRVEAYAYIGDVQSDPIGYEFVVHIPTGIDEMMGGKTIANQRFFNMAGQEMQEANGVTIVVTTYTDGTTSAVKVMK